MARDDFLSGVEITAHFILSSMNPGCSSATTLIMNRLEFGCEEFSKRPDMISQPRYHPRSAWAPLGVHQSRRLLILVRQQQFPLMTCEPYATIVADSSVRVSTSHCRLLQGLFRCDVTSCLVEGRLVSCWKRTCPPSWEITWFDGTRSQRKWIEITRNRSQRGG